MKQQLIKVKDHDYLLKDKATGAILNTDPNALLKHQQRMTYIQREKLRDEEINNIKNDISEIRNMLKMLIEKD